MKLLSDRIFIKLIEKPSTTKSGLFLPAEIAEPEYEVFAVGVRCKGLKVGDKIRFYPHIDKIPHEDGYFARESEGIKVVL